MEGRWNEKCSCFTVEVSRISPQRWSPTRLQTLSKRPMKPRIPGLVDSKLDGKLDVSLWDELKVDIEARCIDASKM